MKHVSVKQLAAVILVLSGLLAGTALPELICMGDGSYAGFASLYALKKYETAEVNYVDIFSYILSIRILVLLVLWMSCFTPVGFLVHLLFFWWLAIAGGMLLALYALRDGWNGLILFGCSLLPQWILYSLMWKQEVEFLCQWQGRETRRTEPGERPGKRALLGLGQMMGLCSVGCVCEAFLGIRLINFFSKIFM